MLRARPFFISAFLLSCCAWGAAPEVSPSSAPPFPGSIHSTLDQEYPGWVLSPVTPQIQQEFKKHNVHQSPSVAVGDFDQNGEKDFAVQITLNTPGQEEQFVIVFLAKDGSYEENIVQSMGPDPTVYLWVLKRAVSGAGENGAGKLTNRDILIVLGGPAGDTLYTYDEGKFHEMPTPEDPEHPDPTIPRP